MKRSHGRAQIPRMMRRVHTEYPNVKCVKVGEFTPFPYRVQSVTGSLLLGYGDSPLAAWRMARDYVLTRKFERALAG